MRLLIIKTLLFIGSIEAFIWLVTTDIQRYSDFWEASFHVWIIGLLVGSFTWLCLELEP